MPASLFGSTIDKSVKSINWFFFSIAHAVNVIGCNDENNEYSVV